MNFFGDDRAERVFDLFNLDSGQLNISHIINPGHIVAWHGHDKQTDYWYCVQGSFKVGLLNLYHHVPHYFSEHSIKYSLDSIRDNRYGSLPVKWEYLTSRNPRVLEIPPGVMHGYKALEPNSIMLYYLSHKYDPNDEITVRPETIFGESWDVENK